MRNQHLLYLGLIVFIVMLAGCVSSGPVTCNDDSGCQTYQYCSLEKKTCEMKPGSCNLDNECSVADNRTMCDVERHMCIFKGGLCDGNKDCSGWEECDKV